MEKVKQIERSIITTYRDKIWHNFIKAIKEYQLVNAGDSIAVCISGGKDSFLLAKLMQELKRHSKVPFSLHFIVMNPGYNEENQQLIDENSKLLEIPTETFKTNIFDSVKNIEKNPCYICARMRRGYLYKKAQSLGCNKIALGHHFNDVIETIVMGMLYSAQLQSMPPKLDSTNHKGMQLIRPLYYIKEKDIINWQKHNDLKFLQCACRFTEEQEKNGEQHTGKRKEVKELIYTLKKKNPLIEMNIFKSSYNVFADTFINYSTRQKKHYFLDRFETEKKEDNHD